MLRSADKATDGVEPMRFFTVCAKNYLAHAIALGEQLKIHHPEAAFTIFLADKTLGIDPDSIPFEIVTLEEVGLVSEREMIVRYNITELCTAIKPYCFLYLFDQAEDPVVYLDPDIYVVSPLVEVEEALAEQDAIVTPHIVRPQERGELRSETFLRFGIYNLGFLALGWSQDSEAFLVWWAERLEAQGGIDIDNGIFVDQKWADFVPAFIEKSLVLRHDGYNVAYWNLHNRTVEEMEGSYTSNGVPLRFVHFSAVPDASDPSISKRYPVFSVDNQRAIGSLLDQFRQLLRTCGQHQFESLDFGYFLQPTDETNIHFPEHIPTDGKDAIFPRTTSNYLLARSVTSEADYRRALIENFDIEQDRRAVESELLGLVDADGFLDLDFFDALVGEEKTFRLRPVIRNNGQKVFAAACLRSRSLLHIFGQELQPKRNQEIGVWDAVGDCEGWLIRHRIPHKSLLNPLDEEYERELPPASLDFVVVNPTDTLGCNLSLIHI